MATDTLTSGKVNFCKMGNSLADSVRFFDERTNNGIVLDLDISERDDLGPRQVAGVKLVLTSDEVTERTNWVRIRGELEAELLYRRSNFLTQEEILQRRVAAPVLNPQPEKPSEQSKPSEQLIGRIYAHRVEVWDKFPSLVSQTRPTGKFCSPREFPFILGLSDRHRKSDERSEELYLIVNALIPLYPRMVIFCKSTSMDQ